MYQSNNLTFPDQPASLLLPVTQSLQHIIRSNMLPSASILLVGALVCVTGNVLHVDRQEECRDYLPAIFCRNACNWTVQGGNSNRS